jgi:excisionase family DNA binding protein
MDSLFAVEEKQAATIEQLLRPSEVATRLGVSRTWLYDAAKDGRIPSVRLGGEDGPLRFVPGDLRAWIEASRAGVPELRANWQARSPGKNCRVQPRGASSRDAARSERSARFPPLRSAYGDDVVARP